MHYYQESLSASNLGFNIQAQKRARAAQEGADDGLYSEFLDADIGHIGSVTQARIPSKQHDSTEEFIGSEHNHNGNGYTTTQQMNSLELHSIEDQDHMLYDPHSQYLAQMSNDEGTGESDIDNIDERPEENRQSSSDFMKKKISTNSYSRSKGPIASLKS